MPGGPQDALLATITQSSLLLALGALLMLVLRRAGMPGGRVSSACAGGLLAGILLGPMVLGRIAPDLHEDLTIGGRAERVEFDDSMRQLLREVEILGDTGVTREAVLAHVDTATPGIAALQTAYSTRATSQHMLRAGLLCVFLAVFGFSTGRRWHRHKLAATEGSDGQRAWAVMVGGLGMIAVLGLQSVPIVPKTLALLFLPVALAGTLLSGDLVPPIRDPSLRGAGAGLSVTAILGLALLAVRVRDPFIYDGTQVDRLIPVNDEVLSWGCAANAVTFALTTYLAAAAIGVASAGAVGDSPRVRHALRAICTCTLVLLAGQSASRAHISPTSGYGLELSSGVIAAMFAIVVTPWLLVAVGFGLRRAITRRDVLRFARAVSVSLIVLGGVFSLVSTQPLFHLLVAIFAVSGLTLGICSDLMGNTRRTASVQREQRGVDTASY